MTDPMPVSDPHHRVVLVGRYLTPLALTLGVLAVVFGDAGRVRNSVALGLLAFAAFFNMKFIPVLVAQSPARRGRVVRFRLILNFAINATVVFLLGAAFPPLWLLLALTPLATAVYGQSRESGITATAAALLLILIQGTRPASAPTDFAIQVAQGAFIVFLSLLVNAVSRHARA